MLALLCRRILIVVSSDIYKLLPRYCVGIAETFREILQNTKTHSQYTLRIDRLKTLAIYYYSVRKFQIDNLKYRSKGKTDKNLLIVIFKIYFGDSVWDIYRYLIISNFMSFCSFNRSKQFCVICAVTMREFLQRRK